METENENENLWNCLLSYPCCQQVVKANVGLIFFLIEELREVAFLKFCKTKRFLARLSIA